MAFGPPNFNLTVNLWRVATPIGNPPDLVFTGNLSCRKNGSVQFSGSVNALWEILQVELLCPKRTDIRGRNTAANFDRVEVPAGTGRFYFVAQVEDVGRGFLNEYRLARIFPLTSEAIVLTGQPWGALVWPEPTP